MTCKLKKSWIDIEMEHSSLFPKAKRRLMAKKIAQQHLDELGCDYYPALIKMEAKLKRQRKKK